MKRKLGRRGDEIVEAAIVLPVMILTILSLILLTIYFFARLQTQCDVQRELIEEAMGAENAGLYETYSLSKKTSSDMGGITRIFLTSEYEEMILSVDEAEMIRLGELIEG